MELFFEDDPPFSPLKKQLTVSTPCVKGKTPTFPSNVTPVAVKQLFTQSNGRHLSDFTWSSSLATGFQSEDSDVDGNQDMTSNAGREANNLSAADDASKSLFSSWIEDDLTLSEDARQPPVTRGVGANDSTFVGDHKIVDTSPEPVPVDSLSDLLKTPPSFMSKRLIIPRKRSGDSSDSILDGIINQPSLSKRKKSANEEISAESSLISNQPASADPKSGNESNFDTPARAEASSSSFRKSHNSAFKHNSKPGGNKSSVSAQQYKPVRPLGVSKRNFYYPSSRGVSDDTNHSPVKSVREKSPPLVKPRRLTKFSAPLRAEEDNHVGNKELLTSAQGQMSLTSSDSGFTSPTLRLETPLPSNMSTPSTRNCSTDDNDPQSMEHLLKPSNNSIMEDVVEELPIAIEDKAGLDDSIRWESRSTVGEHISQDVSASPNTHNWNSLNATYEPKLCKSHTEGALVSENTPIKNSTLPGQEEQVSLTTAVSPEIILSTPDWEPPKNPLVVSILSRFCTQQPCKERVSSPPRPIKSDTLSDTNDRHGKNSTPSISNLLNLVRKTPRTGNRQNDLHVSFSDEVICSSNETDAKEVHNSSPFPRNGTAEPTSSDCARRPSEGVGSTNGACSDSNTPCDGLQSNAAISLKANKESDNGFEVIASEGDDENQCSMDESSVQMVAKELGTTNETKKQDLYVPKSDVHGTENVLVISPVGSCVSSTKVALGNDFPASNVKAIQNDAHVTQHVNCATTDGEEVNVSPSNIASAKGMSVDLLPSATSGCSSLSPVSRDTGASTDGLTLSSLVVNSEPNFSKSATNRVLIPDSMSDAELAFQSSGCDNVMPKLLLLSQEVASPLLGSDESLMAAENATSKPTNNAVESAKIPSDDSVVQQLSLANELAKSFRFATAGKKAIVSDSSLRSMKDVSTDVHFTADAPAFHSESAAKHATISKSKCDMVEVGQDNSGNESIIADAQTSSLEVNEVDGEATSISINNLGNAHSFNEKETVKISCSTPSPVLSTAVDETNISGACSKVAQNKFPTDMNDFDSQSLRQNPTEDSCHLPTPLCNATTGKSLRAFDSSMQAISNSIGNSECSLAALHTTTTQSMLGKSGEFSDEFSTAGGNKIAVQNSSLQTVQSLFMSGCSSLNLGENSANPVEKTLQVQSTDLSSTSAKDISCAESAIRTAKSDILHQGNVLFKQPSDISVHTTAVAKGDKISSSSCQSAQGLLESGHASSSLANSGKKLICSKPSFPSVKGILQEDAASLKSSLDVASTSSIEFTTAAGRDIHVSDSSVHAVQGLFESEYSLASTEDLRIKEQAVGFYTASGKNIACSEYSLQAVEGIFDENVSMLKSSAVASRPSEGFGTATGKEIQVSNSSLQAVRDILDSDHSTSNPGNEKMKMQTAGFSTVSGKKVACSESAVKGIFEESSDLLKLTGGTSRPALGFSTAAGKSIPVSKSSLQAVQGPFELDLSISNYQNGNMKAQAAGGFSTASGKKVTFSKSALKAVKSIVDESSEALKLTDVTSKSSGGFSTAAGKDIQVSKSSLQAVRGLFESDQSISNRKNGNLKVQTAAGFSTASGKKVTCSESALLSVKGIFDESSELLKSSSVASRLSPGFSTAAGKQIQVASSSLQAVRGLFDSDRSIPSFETGNMKMPTAGFSTASGKKVACSESALQAVKGIFDEYAGSSKSPTVASNFTAGFSTAAGQKIQVSGSSLQAVRGLFESDDSLSSAENVNMAVPTAGFSSVAGKNLNCAESTSKVVQDVFSGDAVAFTSSINMTPAYSAGFSTAAGQKVTISESHLQAAKLIFQESNIPANSITQNSNNVNHSEDGNGTKVCENLARHNELLDELNTYMVEKPSSEQLRSENDSIQLCRRVPEGCPDPSVEAVDTCSTPPVTRRFSVFRDRSPLWVSPNGLARNRSLNSKPYWTTPNNSAKKFSFGNKPFKAHTPDREALARKLEQEKTTSIKRSLQPATAESEKQCDTTTGAECALPNETLSYGVQDKPENLKKPSQLMMSAKNQRGRRTLRALGPPTTEFPSNVTLSTATVSSASAAGYSFTRLSKKMVDEIRSLCASDVVEEHLTPPVTAEKLYICFQLMPGVDPSLISTDWFNNHCRWIVWKLACVERSYSHMYTDLCNPLEVLRQMKYRYEREVDLCQRSALKKIYEGDDVAGKPLVLVVSKVGPRHGDDSSPQNGYELELSDGWYDITATYDSELNTLISKGKIKEGTKLLIVGGQLLGMHQGCPPLSAQAKDVQLKICTNSVRRARYDARLGYTSVKFTVTLRSLLPLGGAVPCLQVLVATVYPIVYMEKTATGTVFRNELREQQEQRADAARRDKLMEQELNKENLTDQEAGRERTHRYTEADVRQACTGLELFNLVQTSVDPHTVQEMMTERQREKLFIYQQTKMQQRTATIQSKVKARLPPERSVVPMLKVRVISTHDSDRATDAWTMLTLWRPTHEMLTLLKEGCVYNAHNLSVSALRGQKVNAPVLLSASKRSMFEKISLSEKLIDELFQPKQICPLNNIYDVIIRTSTVELDTAGIVIGWESPKDSLTVVYISDCEGHMLALTVWGGLKAHGYTDRVKEGQLLYCSNLQKTSSTTRYGLPNVAVNELSNISTSCPQKLCNDYTQELSALKSEECKSLVKRCQKRLLELARQREHNCKAQPSRYQVCNQSKRSLHPLDDEIPSANEVPLSSRRALGRQFHSPLVKRRAVSSTIQAAATVNRAAGADDHEDEVSDSQLLDCIL